MSANLKRAARTSAVIAYRQVEKLTEHELEDVLITLVECGENHEAEMANDQLYHLRERRRLQLTLASVLDGTANKTGGAAT